MDACIKPTFWSDRRLEQLDVYQKHSILWLLTNPHRDPCGFTEVTARRFTFETSLPIRVLDEACRLMEPSFLALPGGIYFAARFMHHQCGNGGGLSLENPDVAAAVRHARALPAALRDAFFTAYAELASVPAKEAVKTGAENGSHAVEPPAATEEPAIPPASTISPVENGAHPDPASIAGLYPRRQSVREAMRHISRHIADGVDPRAIADGTRAIAAIIRQLPSGHLNAYVPSAEKFFASRRWEDDPQTWLRLIPGKGRPTTMAAGGQPQELSLGGRTATTVRLPGLPATDR